MDVSGYAELASLEAELHHKTEDNGENKGECGPGSGGAQTLSESLDDDDEDVEGEHAAEGRPR